jgi:hypothetical protein
VALTEVFVELLAHWRLTEPSVVAHDSGGAIALGAHLERRVRSVMRFVSGPGCTHDGRFLNRSRAPSVVAGSRCSGQFLGERPGRGEWR